MGKDAFEMPDMSDLSKQLQDAMVEAQKALEELPAQLSGLEEALGSLSALSGSMSTQLEDLGAALDDFEGKHQANVELAAGDPDWAMEARIRVGTKLDVAVEAVLSVETIRQAWSDTQDSGFEALVGATVAEAGVDVEDGQMGQIMEQLRKGRSIAVVKALDVLAAHIQGSPKDAKETLQLSPEANIPLALDEGELTFEFAPLLTIRNKWENADIPTFSPMGEEIRVPMARFDDGKAFELRLKTKGQEQNVEVDLGFRPLA